MAIVFSASTGFFYETGLAYSQAIPEDAVAVTPARHGVLLLGQAEGRAIVGDAKGRPQLAAHAVTSNQLIRAIKLEAAARIAQISPWWRQFNDQRQPSEASHIRFAQIDAIRVASGLIEDQIGQAKAGQLAKFPIGPNPLWPQFSPIEESN